MTAKGYVLTQSDGTLKVPEFTNIILVQALADFPAPVAGVITLADNTLYKLGPNINVGTNRFVMGDNSQIGGIEDELSSLIYTGVGDMFTAINKSFHIQNVTITAASGTVFNVSGTSIEECILIGVHFIDCGTIGTITSLGDFHIFETSFEDTVTNGITFSGTFDHLFIRTSEIDNCGGVSFDLGSITAEALMFVTTSWITNATQTAIKAVAPTITGQAIIVANTFNGVGTFLNGITTATTNFVIKSNSGVSDSEKFGESTFSANATATTIAVAGTFVKAAGTTTAGTNSQFTQTNNRLTYNGVKTTTFRVFTSCSVSTPNNNQTLAVRLSKNGTTITTTEMEVRQNTANQPVVVASIGFITLATNDFIEVFVTNKTATNNVTVEYMGFVAS